MPTPQTSLLDAGLQPPPLYNNNNNLVPGQYSGVGATYQGGIVANYDVTLNLGHAALICFIILAKMRLE